MICALLARSPEIVPLTMQRAAARHLLTAGLVELGGPTQVELEYNRFGRPNLRGCTGLHFSVAHCPQAVVVLLADRPVGVDVEQLRPHDRYAAARCLASPELAAVAAAADPDRAFFRLWTLKESYVKAVGVGLSYSLRNVQFEVGAAGEVQSNRAAAFHLAEQFEGLVVAACSTSPSERFEPSFRLVDWPVNVAGRL